MKILNLMACQYNENVITLGTNSAFVASAGLNRGNFTISFIIIQLCLSIDDNFDQKKRICSVLLLHIFRKRVPTNIKICFFFKRP
jgi:hypothetical protein